MLRSFFFLVFFAVLVPFWIDFGTILAPFWYNFSLLFQRCWLHFALFFFKSFWYKFSLFFQRCWLHFALDFLRRCAMGWWGYAKRKELYIYKKKIYICIYIALYLYIIPFASRNPTSPSRTYVKIPMQNATNIVEKLLKTCTKMVPRWYQNRPKIGSGRRRKQEQRRIAT